MDENPHLSNSPFLSRTPPEIGESFSFNYHPARRNGLKFLIPRKVSVALTVLLLGAFLGYIIATSSFPGLLPLILVLWAISGLWRGPSHKQPNKIVIDGSLLRFPPLGSVAIQFSDVRIYEESASHIDIYHEQISGLSKLRILRHEFYAPDWDRLGPMLQERVRLNSPDARIHTPLNPPDRKLFRTGLSDKS